MIIIPEIICPDFQEAYLKKTEVLFRLISLVLCLSICPGKFFLDIRDRRGGKVERMNGNTV